MANPLLELFMNPPPDFTGTPSTAGPVAAAPTSGGNPLLDLFANPPIDATSAGSSPVSNLDNGLAMNRTFAELIRGIGVPSTAGPVAGAAAPEATGFQSSIFPALQAAAGNASAPFDLQFEGNFSSLDPATAAAALQIAEARGNVLGGTIPINTKVGTGNRFLDVLAAGSPTFKGFNPRVSIGGDLDPDNLTEEQQSRLAELSPTERALVFQSSPQQVAKLLSSKNFKGLFPEFGPDEDENPFLERQRQIVQAEQAGAFGDQVNPGVANLLRASAFGSALEGLPADLQTALMVEASRGGGFALPGEFSDEVAEGAVDLVEVLIDGQRVNMPATQQNLRRLGEAAQAGKNVQVFPPTQRQRVTNVNPAGLPQDKEINASGELLRGFIVPQRIAQARQIEALPKFKNLFGGFGAAAKAAMRGSGFFSTTVANLIAAGITDAKTQAEVEAFFKRGEFLTTQAVPVILQETSRFSDAERALVQELTGLTNQGIINFEQAKAIQQGFYEFTLLNEAKHRIIGRQSQRFANEVEVAEHLEGLGWSGSEAEDFAVQWGRQNAEIASISGALVKAGATQAQVDRRLQNDFSDNRMIAIQRGFKNAGIL